MRWLRQLLTRRERYDELEALVREHLEEKVADLMDGGMSRADAEFAARREFGNVALIEERSREVWQWAGLELLLSDLKYAIRKLWRSPAFTVTAVLTLAFGIGANLGVFQLLYSVILAQLPVPHPEQLSTLHVARTPFDQDWAVSYPAYQRLRQATPEAPLLAFGGTGRAVLDLPHRAEIIAKYELVSDNYFGVLGVRPAAGRLLIAEDARIAPSEWPVVLRYDFARDTFGSAAQAVGQHFRFKQRAFVVVGVAARSYAGLIAVGMPDFWIPIEVQSSGGYWTGFDSLGPGHDVHLDKPWYNQPTIFWLYLMARIPPGKQSTLLAKWDQAFRADRILMTEATPDPAAKAAALRLITELIPGNHGFGVIRKFSMPLTLLMALSGSIFVVGCLNLANLKLARLHARAHELGVRMALGASKLRLLRQIVLEDSIVVMLGSAAAYAVGRSATGILVRWASNRNSTFSIDLHPGLLIASVGIGLMFVSLLSFSILPAMIFMRSDIGKSASSRAKVTGISQTARQRWRSNALLCAQVSLSLLLSTMSACFAATLVHWENVDVGMDREHVLSVIVDMKRYYDHPSSLPVLFHEMQERLQSVPGVQRAAVELCGSIRCGWITALYVHGRSGLTDTQVHGQEDHVGPGYFDTVGIPILRGRDFNLTDTEKTQPVAIVSRSYARKLFGDDNPIGQWVGYEPSPNDRKFQIVGEVADARVNGPQDNAPPVAYMDIDQNPVGPHSIKVRTVGDPTEIAPRVRDALHSAAPLLTIGSMWSLSAEMDDRLGTEKLLARLAGIYASLTLLLMGIGFYGVMSSRTARRRSEFGIRLALGATRRNVQMLIVSQTARILLAGIIPGVAISIFSVRLASHLLYGSVNANLLAIISAAFVLALAGLVAALIPARRAAYVDPLESLRSE